MSERKDDTQRAGQKEIAIRKGGLNDSAAVFDLMRLAFGDLQGKIQPESSVFKETLDSIRARFDSQTLLVACDSQAPDMPIVGCIFCFPKENAFYFGRLSVHPNYQGCGIAQRLIQQVENEAERAGYQIVFLEVRIVLTQNIGLFQRCGYEIKSSHAHHGYDYPTYYTMIKKISPKDSL